MRYFRNWNYKESIITLDKGLLALFNSPVYQCPTSWEELILVEKPKPRKFKEKVAFGNYMNKSPHIIRKGFYDGLALYSKSRYTILTKWEEVELEEVIS